MRARTPSSLSALLCRVVFEQGLTDARPRMPRVRFCIGLLFALLPAMSAAGPWRADAQNSAGWQFMTPAERVEHQRRMRSFSSLDECKAYQAEHHEKMAERARSAGIQLRPRDDSGCAQLRARGRLK